MIILFHTAINAPIFIGTIVLYFITSAITTFDIRMIQARRDGRFVPEEQMLPDWVKWIYWVDWLVALVLLLLNWKIAIMIFITRFILKVLPVLETIGNLMMAPFKKKK